MRTSLQAITAELKRLKASGVKTLPVSEASLQRLRAAVGTQAKKPGIPVAPPAPASAEPEPVARPVTAYQAPVREIVVKAVDPTAAPIPAPTPFTLPAGDKATRWAALRARVLEDPVCRAHVRPGKQVVFGVGSTDARIMFVGEAPGAEEDARGEPFVGQAGKLLDAMLASLGLARGKNVYIANAVKCRPPGNRTPEADEIATCHPYLDRQIELIRPRIIVALGRPAAQTLLGGEIKIAAARGRLFERKGVPVVVTYHPAYLLRNPQDKARAWEDLCFARASVV